MKIKKEVDFNLIYLSNVLDSLSFFEFPDEVKLKIIDLVNFIDSYSYLKIPDNYDILDEKLELTYYLKSHNN